MEGACWADIEPHSVIYSDAVWLVRRHAWVGPRGVGLTGQRHLAARPPALGELRIVRHGGQLLRRHNEHLLRDGPGARQHRRHANGGKHICGAPRAQEGGQGRGCVLGLLQLRTPCQHPWSRASKQPGRTPFHIPCSRAWPPCPPPGVFPHPLPIAPRTSVVGLGRVHELAARAPQRRKGRAASKQHAAVRPRVRLLKGALGLAGGVAEGEDDGPLVLLRHQLQDLCGAAQARAAPPMATRPSVRTRAAVEASRSDMRLGPPSQVVLSVAPKPPPFPPASTPRPWPQRGADSPGRGRHEWQKGAHLLVESASDGGHADERSGPQGLRRGEQAAMGRHASAAKGGMHQPHVRAHVPGARPAPCPLATQAPPMPPVLAGPRAPAPKPRTRIASFRSLQGGTSCAKGCLWCCRSVREAHTRPFESMKKQWARPCAHGSWSTWGKV